MEIVGFAHINYNAKTCKGALNPDDFIGKICAVMEFASEGGVLVLNPDGNALAMFDKEDVRRSFHCGYTSGVVLPPNLNMFDQMIYIQRAINRKGGYPPIVRQMVIGASLGKGEFCDNFLWQKQ